MSETKPVEDNSMKEYVEKLNEIAKQVDDGFKSVDQKVAMTQKKTDDIDRRLAAKKEEKEGGDELDLYESESIMKAVDKRVETKTKEIETRLKKTGEFQSECAKWDQKAFGKFPELKNEKSDFRRMVDKELENEYPMGTDEHGRRIISPMAIYNAASRVAAERPDLVVRIPEDEAGGGNFGRTIKGKDMTEAQKDIASFYSNRYKMDNDRLKDRCKKHNERNGNRIR